MQKKIAVLLGIIFLALALLGNSGFSFIGPFGFFETNTLHDVLHLGAGALLLLSLMGSQELSGEVIFSFGVVFFIIGVLGFLITPEGGMLLGIFQESATDNWLHLALAAVMIPVPFIFSENRLMTSGK